MSIRDSDVQRVREATDLVALIGRRVSLKRVGSRHVGLCPFHTEKTPSFSVNGAEGFYHCFGCKASGDAITFLRETEHLDFTDAVEQLAAAANIELTYDAPGAQRANQRRKELLDLLERAARFYHERLMSSPDAGEARAYLRRRGYDRETVVKWRLGYAPPLWDALCQHLGSPPDQLAAAGLAYADPASDFFRDRVMFPISDASGRVVSFAGRVLPRSGEPSPKGPKYKNTAGTAVYDKSKVLYGLHLAKQAARSTGRIVVCEGHTDVIGCELAGVFEAVATCGTALTKQHAELLSRSAKRIVLAFDADAAGQTAAERVHQWEREYGLDIFVASLPQGSDPGELASSNPPALYKALDEAMPLRAFRAERILHRADLDSPAGRDRAANEVAEVFAVYPPEVLLDADLLPAAQGIPMDVGKFRERVDVARRRLNERAAVQRRREADRTYEATDYGYDDRDYPDEPGGDYSDYSHLDEDFASRDSGSDPGTGPGSRVSGRGRRIARQRNADARKQVESDVALLAAAWSPESDLRQLVVPELFATPAGREAFARMTQDEGGVQREADTPDDPSLGNVGPASEMLTAAAEASVHVSLESAKDRVATAWMHFVRDLIAIVSAGGDIPRIRLESQMPEAEHIKFRDQCLRWLRQREPELRDLGKRIAAVQELRQWLDSLGEPVSAP
ncbi:MAG: DNA primase [Acidimicrobiales bacterium]|nr:DNA primase [Acidimicrobiales bacterium]MXX42348.1 DNA primase [Acidimicrobiales bacterium]MYB81218.1 DNA primase [Acidimicrobiales bacterium]MYI10149.1 DNA primase [Acidimicrobiales bacterium]MYI13164.1 DNA primase [Acidimicrobiales bacterium]